MGLTDFRISDWRAGERVPAARRPEYYPVLYTEPFARSEAAIGLNLASDAMLDAALARSGDNGETLATGVVSLAEGSFFDDAFLVFRPIYRKGVELVTVGLRRENLMGFAVGIFRIGEIVTQSTNLQIDDPIVPHLHVFVYDQTASDGPRLLHPKAPQAGAPRTPLDYWSYGREIVVAGRTWLIDFRLDPGTQALPGKWIFWGALLAGLAGTGMLIAVLALMAYGTRESVKAANAIRESEERFRDFAETAADMFWETDENHEIVYLSSSVATQPADPVGGRGGAGQRDRGALGDPGKVLEKVSRYLEVREPFRDLEYPIVYDGDGDERFVQNSGKPIFDTDGNFRGFRGTAIDISEHKNRELQLRHFQKMEAVGQVTGGLAHDLNNVLSIISMNVSLLKEAGLDSPQAATCFETAMNGVTRAADLTRKLLDFSRKEAGETRRVCVNEFIRGMESLIAKSLTPKISLRTDLAENTWLVDIDPGGFEDAVLNLALNARDAMPDGGSLIIETANKVVDESYAYRNPGSSAGEFVMIAVSDTGTGMTPETVRKAFEPFFTTKERGKGTGLGLATVYGIVRQHGGMIQAYSELGKGTTVKVYLPIVERRAISVGTRVEGPVLCGDETILLAEDDPMVRNLAKTILERAGYTVLQAEDGEEAVALYGQHEGEVALLLLDVVMPGMGGRAVYERIREIRPDIPALFTSGYSENAIHTNFVLEDGLTLLPKPFAREALLRAVRKVLDGDQDTSVE